MSDYVIELYERNLDNILSTLRSNAGRRGLVFRHISNLCDPKEYPRPWPGPFPLPKSPITDISDLLGLDMFLDRSEC